jgi:hypothetical protein
MSVSSSAAHAVINATHTVMQLSSSSSSSTGSSSSDSLPFDLNNLYIGSFHVPLAALIVAIIFIALLLVCAVVSTCCRGALFCVHKTETVVDEAVQDFKGGRAQKDLLNRKQKLALIRSAQRSDDLA